MAIELIRVTESKPTSLGSGAAIVAAIAAILLAVFGIEYLFAAPDLIAGKAVSDDRIPWPWNPPVVIVAVVILIAALAIGYLDVWRATMIAMQTDATYSASIWFSTFPDALRTITPARGRVGWILPQIPTAWEWDLLYAERSSWRVEFDYDRRLVRVSRRDLDTESVNGAPWIDLGGTEPWWDPPPSFSPHRREEVVSFVDTPPPGATVGARAGRLFLVVFTLVAAAFAYFSEPSWTIFLVFVLLVSFIAWVARARATARISVEQVWRVAVAAALTRRYTLSDLDALQITAGRLRHRADHVTISSRVFSGPARGGWIVTVPRSVSHATLESQVMRGRFRLRTVAVPVLGGTDRDSAPEADGH